MTEESQRTEEEYSVTWGGVSCELGAPHSTPEVPKGHGDEGQGPQNQVLISGQALRSLADCNSETLVVNSAS